PDRKLSAEAEEMESGAAPFAQPGPPAFLFPPLGDDRRSPHAPVDDFGAGLASPEGSGNALVRSQDCRFSAGAHRLRLAPVFPAVGPVAGAQVGLVEFADRKSTRLNSSHVKTS